MNYFKQLDKENIWIDDNYVITCHNCEISFNLFNRRHHCRICGNIFCSSCSNYNLYTNINKSNEIIKIEDYLLECLNTKINNFNYKKKICIHCNKLLIEIKNISKIIIIFELLPINLKYINKLLLVNKIWNKSAIFYLYNFKKFNTISVYDNINFKMFNILNINFNLICGHNKLVILYILNNNWNNYKKNEIINILNILQKKKYSCDKLLCSSHCCEKLSNYDIIYLLNYIKNYNLKLYLLSILNIDKIDIYLPLFINLIKTDNIDDYSITDYIYDKCNNNLKILIELFFQMFIIINNKNYSFYQSSLQRIKSFLKKNNNNLYKNLKNSIQLINNINSINQNNFNIQIEKINKIIKKDNNLIIPFFNKKIKYISNNVFVKESNSKPLLLEIIFEDNTSENILLKNEDIRIDYVIYKIILLIKKILRDNDILNIDNYCINYEVLPINNNSGIVQIIKNSFTLYHIKEKLHLSLQNFILNNNRKEIIDNIKDKYIYSYSIYCVITYLLGVGDRHLDNIMITKDGLLFHIDYSYCLGYDPKPLTSYIRITDEMIDMIGGYKSADYNRFICISNTYYNIIRIYTNFISLYLLLFNNINSNKFNNTLIKTHIKKKFIYSHSNNYAISIFNEIIEQSSNDYKYIDFIHYHSKEETVSKVIFNIYDITLNIPNYIYKYINI